MPLSVTLTELELRMQYTGDLLNHDYLVGNYRI